MHHALGHPHVAVSTPVLYDWQKDWVAAPKFNVKSFLSGSDFALLALFGVQRQDTLLAAFCHALLEQELHVNRHLLEGTPINVTLRYAARRHAPRCLRFHPSRAGAPSSKPSPGRPHHQHCLGSVAKNFLHRRDEDTLSRPCSSFDFSLLKVFCSTQSSGPILQSSISSGQVITCLLHKTSAFFLRRGISARLILWFGERTLQEPWCGVRGIVVWDVVRRLAARTMAQQLSKAGFRRRLHPTNKQCPQALGKSAWLTFSRSSPRLNCVN